jgi:hypothetical protein
MQARYKSLNTSTTQTTDEKMLSEINIEFGIIKIIMPTWILLSKYAGMTMMYQHQQERTR